MKNMISFLTIVLLISSCCKVDNPQNQYCGAENPAEELDWLRIEIKERTIY